MFGIAFCVQCVQCVFYEEPGSVNWVLTLWWSHVAGTVAPTFKDSEWGNETHKKLDAWPREAAGPVVMNPVSRQNYHKV